MYLCLLINTLITGFCKLSPKISKKKKITDEPVTSKTKTNARPLSHIEWIKTLGPGEPNNTCAYRKYTQQLNQQEQE